MRNKLSSPRLFSWPQSVALLVIIAVLALGLDYRQRNEEGNMVGVDEDKLQTEVNLELTRQVEMQATLDYVQSDDYVAAYARDEGGFLQPGEKRVAPLVIEAPPPPPSVPAATPDPAQFAQPWQAWWQLLTDAPPPTR